MICLIKDCRKRHHTIVSAAERILRKDGPGNREEKQNIPSIVSERQNYTTLLKIAPVTNHAIKGKSEDVAAFLDGGWPGRLLVNILLSFLVSILPKELQKGLRRLMVGSLSLLAMWSTHTMDPFHYLFTLL